MLQNWSISTSVKSRLQTLGHLQEALRQQDEEDRTLVADLLEAAPAEIREFFLHNKTVYYLVKDGSTQVPVTLRNEGFGKTEEEAEVVVEKLRRAWLCNVQVEKKPRLGPNVGFTLYLSAESHP